MRVLTVVGNRPQFIKSAPLTIALREAGIEERTVHTGQHYDDEMSEIFFSDLGLSEPTYRLDLRTACVDAMRGELEPIARRERPDAVVVFGDTNSTLAGAEAAVAVELPVAHVEAGLRSDDLSMPEERNRIAVDRLAEILLAPDERSAARLRSEGVRGTAFVVGDVMADAARLFRGPALNRYGTPLAPGSYVLATIHREANVRPERLRRILEGLARLDEPVVLPAHPRTRTTIDAHDLPIGENVVLCGPMGYLEFLSSLTGARVVVTDSGGVQKEAYWQGVPCVTARPSTEWVDTVLAGANVLVDADPDRLVEAVRSARMPDDPPVLYGDGRAAHGIAEVMRDRAAARVATG